MAYQNASPSTLAEHELELAAREAELNRREAWVRRAEESRAEADERSAALDRRERDRLRGEQARLVAASLGRDEMTEDAPPPKMVEVGPDWWSKQLGTPLEAA